MLTVTLQHTYNRFFMKAELGFLKVMSPEVNSFGAGPGSGVHGPSALNPSNFTVLNFMKFAFSYLSYSDFT